MSLHPDVGVRGPLEGRQGDAGARRRGRPGARAKRGWGARALERLEGRALLDGGMGGGGDLLMTIENARVMNLVPDGSFQDTAVKSGPWDDALTWSKDGSAGIPKNMDNVLIPKGLSVTIRRDEALPGGNRVAVHALRVDGTLAFDATVNTRLLVDTIVVTDTGTFQMGTMDTPIQPGVKSEVVFADNGAVNAPANTDTAKSTLWPAGDPYELSRGLIVMGAASINGTEVTSDLTVAANAEGSSYLAKGATKIVLNGIPKGWRGAGAGYAGDRLIVSGDTATNSKGLSQDEQVGVQSIAPNADGTYTITVDAPLAYAHWAPKGAALYVADVSRNAVFESENVVDVADRGHIMFMHTMNVQVDAAGFYGLGRTDKRTTIDDANPVVDPDNPGTPSNPNYTDDVIDSKTGKRVMVPKVDANGNVVKNPDGSPVLIVARTGLNPRGRYVVHFHHDMPGMMGSGGGGGGMDAIDTINDSSVVDSPGWGIVNHSSNVAITGNVVYNALGAAFVTEAGDETGSFVGNIAIHATGSGDGLESRQQFQDFGHQGDGFWFQGGDVDVVNNVAVGMRHSGFILFPDGLIQKMPFLDKSGKIVWKPVTTAVPASALSWAPWAPSDPNAMVPDNNVPFKTFSGNEAYGDGDALETWFSLLNVSDVRDVDRISGLTAFADGGTAVFTPYSNRPVFDHVSLLGNPGGPWGTGFGRNDVTRNATYDHVTVVGFDVGINAPVNGVNNIIGGTFNNLRNVYITTANDPGRRVNIEDGPTKTDGGGNPVPDPIVFVDNLKDGKGNPRTQFDIFLQSNFNPKERDITRLFNPDVIRLGTIDFKGQQVFYNEQGASFVPFPSDPKAPYFGYMPKDLMDKTNAQLFAQYGLAVGGIVAPSDTYKVPKINGLVSNTVVTYAPRIDLASRKYSQFDPTTADYTPKFTYIDAAGKKQTYSAAPVQLVQGWNLITLNFDPNSDLGKYLGPVRTLLVYGDNIPPTFVIDPKVPLLINRADYDNGATWVLEGHIDDDSFGSIFFRKNFSLNDKKYFHLDPANPNHLIFQMPIQDFAGNKTIVTIDLTLSDTAPLQKDLGRKDLPEILPSETLIILLDPDFNKKKS